MTWAELARMLRSNDQLSVDIPIPGIPEGSSQYVLTDKIKPAFAPKLSEYQMQAAVIAECDRRALTDGFEWGLVYAVPNGQYRPGQRMEPGLRKGVPDLCWPVPRGNWHGMYIELKVGDNKPEPEQTMWLDRLTAQGYFCLVVLDFPEVVIDRMDAYLKGQL